MDARAVAKAAEVEVGTLNSWIHRGLIPGMTIGARGRQREFDLETAINVALIVELVRRGLSAPTASAIAKDRGLPSGGPDASFASAIAKDRGLPSKRLLLMFGLPPVLTHRGDVLALRDHMRRAPIPIPFQSEAQLPEIFEKHGGVPDVYTVINLELIEGRMREAYDRWEREQAG